MRNLPGLLGNKDDKPVLPIEQALLIYGMMALSARFSNLPEFSGVARKQRGREFARQSGHILTHILMNSDLDTPSLTFLHGCSLAAVYWLACAPNGRAWFLVGICVRIAYSLSLNTIDDDLRVPEAQPIPVDEWTRREELRRAWWLVVECDNFASIVQCRPLTIDRTRMHVHLPSKDEFWLSGKPCTSAFLDDDILLSWKQLKSSSNRNPHAWYLLVNQLLIRGHEMSLKSRISVEDRRDLQDAIQSVAMSLPQEFQLSRDIISFEEDSVDHDNWVIALHLMLQRYLPLSMFVRALAYKYSALVYVIDTENETSATDPIAGSPPRETRSSSFGSAYLTGGPTTISPAPAKYRPTLNAMIRAVRTWSPEYCVTCQPFQVCTLLGPYAAHLQATFAASSPSRGSLERDLIRETVARIAEYWDIARATLGTLKPHWNLCVDRIA
jgi:hypothetical protein